MIILNFFNLVFCNKGDDSKKIIFMLRKRLGCKEHGKVMKLFNDEDFD